MTGNLFAQIVDAAYRELRDIACARARAIVGSREMAEDMVHDVWVTMLSGTAWDPERGPFAAFFLTSVRNRCLTEVRTRRPLAVPDEIIERIGRPGEDENREHREALERVAGLEAKISEALDGLRLRPQQVAMLRTMIGPEPVPRSSAASEGERQARKRLREQIAKKAGLDKEERSAASLIRRHHNLAAAATAADIEVEELQRRVTAAEKKILGLFKVSDED